MYKELYWYQEAKKQIKKQSLAQEANTQLTDLLETSGLGKSYVFMQRLNTPQ